MWRNYMWDLSFTHWRQIDLKGRCPPKGGATMDRVNDDNAAKYLDIDQSALVSNWERLRIPRISREVWSKYQLAYWLYLNSDAPFRDYSGTDIA